MTRLNLAIVLLLALLPSAVRAQRGGPVAWWENPLANDLNLTEEQRARINSIVADYRERLVNGRNEADRAESELEAVYNADLVDWTRGTLAIDRLVKARGEVTKNISEMTLRLRRVLTAEQWRRLQARESGRGSEGGRDAHEAAERTRRGRGAPAIGSASGSPEH